MGEGKPSTRSSTAVEKSRPKGSPELEACMAEEMFDVVNEDDEVIRQEARSTVHRTGLLHRGVHVLLFAPDGKVLIQRRTEDRPSEPGALDGSVSEHVKAGEDYPSAAERGMKEELGLEGIKLKPVLKFKMTYGPNDNEISELFQGRLTAGDRVRFDPGEVESVGFAELDELHRWLEDGVRPFTKWLTQMLRWAAREPNEMDVLRIYGELGNFPP
jgi:isopentenyldiphosphate isomerase